MTRARRVGRSLCETAGFDERVVDDALLDAAVRRRMLHTGEASADSYGERLEREPAEQDELLEELLVRESWFFRDLLPFELLVDLAMRRWPDACADNPLRILSAPCASGEEPYSIALALAGSGIRHFHVDGVDLSRRGLETARRGRYRTRVLQHVPPELAARFLSAAGNEDFAIVPSLLSVVSWHRANLLQLPEAIGKQRYQVIFGRNVLIYLHANARAQLLQRFEELLAPDGVLVVGHAEAGLLAGSGLESIGSGGAFAFQRRAARSSAPLPRVPQSSLAAPRPTAPRRAQVRNASGAVPPSATRMPIDGAIEEIRALADRGTYQEADSRVRALINGNPASVDAHHLLGLIQAVQGHREAARRAFERAIYLDPQHAPSLEHLALILEGAGELAAAGRLRDRANRTGAHRP